MATKISGIAASDGIGIAKVYMLTDPDLSFDATTVQDTEAEKKRYDDARAVTEKELNLIRAKALENFGQDEAEIFDAHLAMLSDPEFIKQVQSVIDQQSCNAEQALQSVAKQFADTLRAMTDNAYMQERATDVEDVTKRVLSHLLDRPLPNLALIQEPVIVVSHDLTPSVTAQINKQFVKGILVDLGGRTSHSAIMSRTLEIPAIVGTETVTKTVKNGDMAIVDGSNGVGLINPSDAELADYQQRQADFSAQQEALKQLKTQASVSADGQHFTVAANIGTPKDMDGVTNFGAEAIGLFRTEFLYMDSDQLPTEDQQFEAYKTVVQQMNGKPVVIRTMDIGGDKNLSYWKLPKEMNPFLGYRAIRISLDRQDIFRTQLRALLRASAYGKLGIMFPMIATLEELRQAKAIFNEEKTKLVEAGVKVGDDIQLGMMIEIPNSALFADRFAKEVDFFSIGTNDLIQYTFAADRGNERVSYLYQPYHPALLRLIKHVIDCAHREGTTVAMCGEMAGDKIAVPLLMGLGLDEFSMSATSILRTRGLMKTIDTKQAAALAQKAIDTCDTCDEVKQLVEGATKA
ncbi:phosphoenolpyruvate--protein phosphotransferase [Levilactobacillus zymae]|uniref:phosphoenolpyruvate--protein phosphotransferase n=1 Tax=Levilactobacillus zymae TaxID=267363 RepID=UPI0028B4F603|nr:phosphoenolpyruvate--protein phosphotransferase [Levilactobacillus zymae]MDT6981559.1 phosphoenolpyruvate--protein phosphotransferase [Levilactobacillus zymae]